MNRYPWLDAYLLARPGAEKDYKPEWGWFRYRVRGKMYAAVCTPSEKYKPYGGHMLLSLKCEPMLAELFRGQYAAVLPGFYCDKTHWNSIFLDGDVPDDTLRGMCDMAYALIVAKLPKRVQKELTDEASVCE